MGVKDATGECIIGTSEGTVKSRDFKRLADSAERWNATMVKALRGTPWQPTPGRGDDSIPVRVRLAEEGRAILPDPDSIAAPPKPEIKRRARISRADVIRVGFAQDAKPSAEVKKNRKTIQKSAEKELKKLW